VDRKYDLFTSSNPRLSPRPALHGYGAYTYVLYYRDRVLAVAQSTEGRAGLTRCGEGYNLRSMPRVGQFCPSNIAQLLLVVFIIVTLLIAIGFWLYHSPGHGTSIEHSPASDK
jgi:hypothetical protein